MEKFAACLDFDPSRVDFDLVFSFVKDSGTHLCMCWIKTLANAWCTSFRMHEHFLRPCLFGCPADDSLEHYVQCNNLAYVLNIVQRVPLPACGASLEGLLHLLSPSPFITHRVFLAFTLYHYIKQSYPSPPPASASDAERFLFACNLALPAGRAAIRRLDALFNGCQECTVPIV